MDDILSLKEVQAEDGVLLMDLFDYPLPLSRATLLAQSLANDKDLHMFILVNDHVAGIVGLHEGEVGYRIRKDDRNKGIATKALARFLKLCGKNKLKACVRKENAASCRVLERNGFVKVKETGDICHYRWHCEKQMCTIL